MTLFVAARPKRVRGSGLAGWLARGGFFGDTIDHADGVSRMDGVGVGAIIGCLLGIVFGSQWRFGPVATGTAGFMLGGLIGYLFDRLIPEKGHDRRETARVSGLMLVTVSKAPSDKVDSLKGWLKRNGANQIAVVPGAG